MQAHRTPQSGTPSAALSRTDTPGVYRRADRYVTVWRERGRQRKTTFKTLSDARKA